MVFCFSCDHNHYNNYIGVRVGFDWILEKVKK